VSGSPSDLPKGWLETLAELAAIREEYGSIPAAIFALISLYILNGIFSIFSAIVGAVLTVFDVLTGALATAQMLLVGAFQRAGIDILGLLLDLERQIADVVASAGPLGPPLAVGATAVFLYVLYRLSVALLGELPGGSTLVDLLGLR